MRFQLTVLLAAVVAAGCGRKENSSSAPAERKAKAVSVSDTGASLSPADTPEPNAPIAPGVDGGDIDPATKAAIKKYVAKKGTAPRSWIDLTVEQGYLDKIPTGKDGKPLDFDKVMTKLNIQP